jgi:hypothetical protein
MEGSDGPFCVGSNQRELEHVDVDMQHVELVGRWRTSSSKMTW